MTKHAEQLGAHVSWTVAPEDLPDDKHRVLKRAQRLEAWSLAALLWSAIPSVFLGGRSCPWRSRSTTRCFTPTR